MKITDLKIFVVDCYRTNWIFIKIETDLKISGVGEATLEYKEKAVVGALEHIKDYLIGKDPLTIEKHWHHIYKNAYWRGGAVLMSALSAVEMALWDILGKKLGVPIYQLLGGKMRDEIKIYVNGWFSGAKTPKEFASKAIEVVNRGIKALKWDPFGKNYLEISNEELDYAIECVREVRNAVGNHVDILIEGHGRFNVATSIKIANRLAPYNPLFFEEPVPPDNLDALKRVQEKSLVPIAAGERLYTRWGYTEIFDKKTVDFIQPDVSHAGGIMELKKLSAIAFANYMSFVPHNPSGPIATAATLQLAGCCENFLILEIMYDDVFYRKDLTTENLVFKNGCIQIPNKPGLGIELNEEECLKYPYQKHELRHYDGTLTEIRPNKTKFYF